MVDVPGLLGTDNTRQQQEAHNHFIINADLANIDTNRKIGHKQDRQHLRCHKQGAPQHFPSPPLPSLTSPYPHYPKIYIHHNAKSPTDRLSTFPLQNQQEKESDGEVVLCFSFTFSRSHIYYLWS